MSHHYPRLCPGPKDSVLGRGQHDTASQPTQGESCSHPFSTVPSPGMRGRWGCGLCEGGGGGRREGLLSHQVLLKPPPVPASHPSLEKSGSGSGEAGEVWGAPLGLPSPANPEGPNHGKLHPAARLSGPAPKTSVLSWSHPWWPRREGLR